MKVKPYNVQIDDGVISLENDVFKKKDHQIRVMDCDFGIQVAEDGRVWICINGISFLRFIPKIKKRRK